MARNTAKFIASKGRDAGKHFLITEMHAFQAESWAMRAILALIKGGVNVPENWQQMGMAQMAEIGIRALGQLNYTEAKPLLDEMLSCAVYIPDPLKSGVTHNVVDFPDQIEELATVVELRAAVWKLHVDFFKAAAPSLFAVAAQ